MACVSGGPREPHERELSMKKVLSVDDSRVVRTMVARCLQAYGCQIIEAENGQEGIEAAKRERPDLILLDVTMPVMDGKTALAELRKNPATKEIPVIMLTAESGKDLVMEIAKLGVAGYIVKPFTQESFDKHVSKVLGVPQPRAAIGPVDANAVLVVDDSERVLEAAKAAIKDAVGAVHTALGGKEAIELYRKHRPGVVVIDLAMPDIDGFQTLNAIKQLGGAGHFVALSVRGDTTAKEKATEAGFAAVVEKPFQAGDLIAQLKLAAPAKIDECENWVLDQEGCPVIVFPEPHSKSFGRFFALVQKRLRALAEDGNDKLILDLAVCTEVNAALTRILVDILSDARTLGLRTAICAPNETVVTALKAISETREAVYAGTRAAALQGLA